MTSERTQLVPFAPQTDVQLASLACDQTVHEINI